MPRLSLRLIRDLVRRGVYVVSLHAADEMEDDSFTIFDLESILLTGTIIERQRDRATRELKLVIQGSALDLRPACAVVKLGPLGVLFVVTVYAI